MFNRKNNLLMVALLIITVIFTACSNTDTTSQSDRSAKEVLLEAALNDININSQEFKMGVNANLNTNVNDPELTMLAEVLNNSTISIAGKTDVDASITELDLTVNFSGLGINGKAFINEEVVALQIPMLGMFLDVQDDRLTNGYIVFNVEEIMSEFQDYEYDANISDDQYVDIATKFIEMAFDILDDEIFTNKGNEEVTVGNSDLEATRIKAEIGKDEFRSILNNTITLMTEPDFADNLFEILTLFDTNITKAEFDSEIALLSMEIDDNLEENLDEIFNEMSEFIDFENSKGLIDMYIDQGHTVKSIIEMTLNLKDEDVSFALDLNMTTETWNINEPVTIEIPELDETNSIDLFELIGIYLGSLFF
ncbi:hypothetical protein RH915_02545 [Serpentinicella sp. ANB-PHB4]|uniref:DUF6583 family protein n=1 Tax=Serpentinicella sp. ANB-PHB4 TaxID=3074076 RepID=UPI002864BEF1|nr:DUF6583 family protein [Serpentinicella sp. ANB-PHB4]MDR5658361.1 hypothetical protein [Serpentinicella sp. ANB-PHB4]